jgi:uncharacterized protein (DUF305 family)
VGAVLVLVVVAAAAFVAGRSQTRDDPPPADGVDVGFVQDMIDHHEQAILMSSIVLRATDAPELVRNAAVDIIASQRYEIGVMDGWLRVWGHGRGSVTRTDAMRWMGHGMPVAEMEGMATVNDLDRLSKASGGELVESFFALMTAHHQGGIHMAERAAERAREHDVRWLAGQMARTQRHEIKEMESIRLQLSSLSGSSR